MKEKKRKAGRPKLPKGEIKNVIAIRLTDTERRTYERQASKLGMGLSEWVRQAMTKERIANLARKAATSFGNGATYFDAFEVPSKDHEWCIKFLPEMTEISIRPNDFGSDQQIIQEIKRQLDSN
jgi:hypothetical protein